jgi:nucleoside-diphosphate-sugar epimerase
VRWIVKVFVVGGTGALGREAICTLVGHGHHVTALARTPAKAAWLRDHGAHPVGGSLFDESELARCFKGHDAVANLASALPATWKFAFPWAWRANSRVRSLGSAAVVNAALATAVPRIIQESVSMIYPDRGAEWIDETVPPEAYPMAEANLAAETNNRRFTAAGGAGVLLRFGWFYGPGATHSEEFYALARRHVCIQMGKPHTYVSSIHVADAGRAVAAALDTPAGTYNVVDDEPLTKRAYADALAHAADTSAWLRVPGRAAHLLGNRTTSLTRSLRVSNREFKRASAWAPRYPSAREGWLATAKALRSPSDE